MKRLFIRPLLLFVATGLVFGCAKRYATVARELRDAPVCCTSLEQLPAEPLAVGDSREIELGEGSPVYRFETGKSYFRAFALPTGSHPYRVTLESFPVGGHLKSAYLFYPQLITLDSNHRVVRATGPGSFSLRRLGFMASVRDMGGIHCALAGDLTFTPDNRDERYLVVLTTDALLKERTAIPSGGAAPVLTLGFSEPELAREEVLVPHGPAGRLRISLAGLASAAAPAGAARDAAPVPRPELVPVRLDGGKRIGELELGRADRATARELFERAGTGFGRELPNGSPFAIGTATITPALLYTPPGTPHQLYFDARDRLVLFSDKNGADLPASGSAFRRRFPAARESGHTLNSYELQAELAPCVTLIAVFRRADDTLDYAAYAYSCPTK